MRVIPDDLAVAGEAQNGPSRLCTATLHALPISCHHTVRSVTYRAYRTLWADEPDRTERWRRISYMDQVSGIGRPLRTMSHGVVNAAIQELEEMGMPEDVMEKHLDNFASLMLWADEWRFITWGRRSEVEDDGHT